MSRVERRAQHGAPRARAGIHGGVRRSHASTQERKRGSLERACNRQSGQREGAGTARPERGERGEGEERDDLDEREGDAVARAHVGGTVGERASCRGSAAPSDARKCPEGHGESAERRARDAGETCGERAAGVGKSGGGRRRGEQGNRRGDASTSRSERLSLRGREEPCEGLREGLREGPPKGPEGPCEGPHGEERERKCERRRKVLDFLQRDDHPGVRLEAGNSVG